MHFFLWNYKTILNIVLDFRVRSLTISSITKVCLHLSERQMWWSTLPEDEGKSSFPPRRPPFLFDPQVYKDISNWWYLAIFVGTTAMAMATIYTSWSGLPWSCRTRFCVDVHPNNRHCTFHFIFSSTIEDAFLIVAVRDGGIRTKRWNFGSGT